MDPQFLFFPLQYFIYITKKSFVVFLQRIESFSYVFFKEEWENPMFPWVGTIPPKFFLKGRHLLLIFSNSWILFVIVLRVFPYFLSKSIAECLVVEKLKKSLFWCNFLISKKKTRQWLSEVEKKGKITENATFRVIQQCIKFKNPLINFMKGLLVNQNIFLSICFKREINLSGVSLRSRK